MGPDVLQMLQISTHMEHWIQEDKDTSPSRWVNVGMNLLSSSPKYAGT